MRPASKMNNGFFISQFVITGKSIALNIALVVVQEIKRNLSAAGWVVPVQYGRMIGLASAKHPHVGLGRIGPAGFI